MRLKNGLVLLISALSVLFPFVSFAATCTPQSAIICVNGDDNSSVWVNGNYIGAFNYVNWDSTTGPVCVAVNPAFLNATGNNVIAVAVTDTAGGSILGSFALDVTCVGGLHSYITSNEGGIKLSATNIWNTPPPVDGEGDSWISLNYNDTAWGNAVEVTTCDVWVKPLYSPSNGQQVANYSYDTCGSSGANQWDPSGMKMLYMRKTFQLNPVTPPPSPTITINKSASQTTQITGPVTFTLQICNTGGGYTTQPLIISDHWNSSAACNWSYSGPWYQNDKDLGILWQSGNSLTVYFPMGMEANTCKSFEYVLSPCWFDQAYSSPAWCSVATNYSSVTWNASAGSSANVPFSLYCPSSTNTPTRTYTPAMTNTFTRTITPSFTVTNSPSFTFTRTVSPSMTATLSWTLSATRSATPSLTLTMSHTLTRTNTATFSRTPSPTHTRTVTLTQVNTATNTPTRTNTNTPSPTQSWTQTYTVTYTRTHTPTVTITTMNTSTFTPTRTPTNTPSPTFSRTLTSTATFTRTNTPTITITTMDTATSTPTRTMTFTATPTYSRTLTSTATFTRTHTPTITITTMDTATATPTHTPSYTASPTFTATGTASYTPTATATFTPSNTRTVTPTVTITSLDTATVTYTVTHTYTDTPTYTATATYTFSFTATDTPTYTATVPNPPTQTVTPTFTPTFTATATPTDTVTVTQTSTDLPTGTATFTATYTCTMTNTPSFTQTWTGTDTPTDVPSGTSTQTPSYTCTVTVTLTYTATPTGTFTATPQGTPALLTIELTSRGDNPGTGAVVTYRIRVVNNDVTPAYNIRVWDTIPSEMYYDSTLSPYVTQVSGNYLQWDMPPGFVLNPGEEFTIVFNVVIINIEEGALVVNTACVDYNDGQYNSPAYRHPAVTSMQSFYPEGIVVVFPNPFDSTTAIGGLMKFSNMVPGALLRVYTLSGENVYAADIGHNTKHYWNCKNRYAKAVSPGVYYWVAKNPVNGRTDTGKIFIVK